MKQIIVLLAFVVLGAFIGATVILGSTGSFKSDAASLGKKAGTEITEYVTGL